MNNEITEDYCSFEVSKLLKEKGLNIGTKDWYQNSNQVLVQAGRNGIKQLFKNTDSGNDFFTSCPTHALAIKWIRENFGIDIETKIWWGGTKQCQYFATIIKREGDSWSDKFRPRNKTFYSPEEATEAAIKYTLKNLI